MAPELKRQTGFPSFHQQLTLFEIQPASVNMERLFHKVEGKIERLFGGDGSRHSHTHIGHTCDDSHPETHTANRYSSFAPQSSGHAKWYVDGASYFWAVSMALEQARESVYILDWWLSPEVRH